MRRRGSLWITAALVAAVLLAGPATPAWAADGGGSAALGRLWAWLAEVLGWELPAAATSDQCASIDPNGHCLAGAQANSDQCLSIDPNGRCLTSGAAATSNSDEGFSIDPDG